MATPTHATPAATPESSIFQGIDEAANAKLPYLDLGVFKAKVDAVKKVQSKQSKDVFVFVEFTLLESSNPALPVGSRVCRGIKMVHPRWGTTYSMPEVKALFGAIVNELPEKVNMETAEALCSPKNPAAGRVINIVGKHKLDKEGKEMNFVAFTYSSAAK